VGITAEVLVVTNFDDLRSRAGEARGKIVLFNVSYNGYAETVTYRNSGARAAAQQGAVAVLVPIDSPDPQATYDLLRREAALYSPTLAAKPHVVVFTKLDLLPPGAPRPEIRSADGAPVVAVSAVTGAAIPALLETLWRTLQHPAVTS